MFLSWKQQEGAHLRSAGILARACSDARCRACLPRRLCLEENLLRRSLLPASSRRRTRYPRAFAPSYLFEIQKPLNRFCLSGHKIYCQILPVFVFCTERARCNRCSGRTQGPWPHVGVPERIGAGEAVGPGGNRLVGTVERATSPLLCRPPRVTRTGSSLSLLRAIPADPVVAECSTRRLAIIPHGAAPTPVRLGSRSSASVVPAQPAGGERCSPESPACGLALACHHRSPQRAMGSACHRRSSLAAPTSPRSPCGEIALSAAGR